MELSNTESIIEIYAGVWNAMRWWNWSSAELLYRYANRKIVYITDPSWRKYSLIMQYVTDPKYITGL